MPDEVVVKVEDVSREFPFAGQVIRAVQGVSFEVKRGDFVAIIGRSGSGKTTLLNMIAGLDRPTSGHIYIDGQDIATMSDGQLTELRRRKIGFVFQSFGLLPLLSAYENIEVALRIAGAGIRERGRRVRELLDVVGLGRRANHRPYELSGGEQQRVAIARALANRPALILADEPTGELDSSTAASIFQLLLEVVERENVTIITTTHDRLVMEKAQRVLELADGVLQTGPTYFERDRREAISVPWRRVERDTALPEPVDTEEEQQRWSRAIVTQQVLHLDLIALADPTDVRARDQVLQAAAALAEVDGVEAIVAIDAGEEGSPFHLALAFVLRDFQALEPFGTDPRYTRFLQRSLAPVLRLLAGADCLLEEAWPSPRAHGECLAVAASNDTYDWELRQFFAALRQGYETSSTAGLAAGERGRYRGIVIIFSNSPAELTLAADPRLTIHRVSGHARVLHE
jgi:putative ABC transport system ATP-binding protein